MVIKEYSDTELRALPPIRTGPDHSENPFKADALADLPGALNLSRRWAQLHWPEAFTDPTEPDDPFEAMEHALSIKRSGMHRTENPETGAVAILPNVPHHAANSKERRAIEDQWEQRAIAQTAQTESENAESQPAEKPAQNTFIKTIRGD